MFDSALKPFLHRAKEARQSACPVENVYHRALRFTARGFKILDMGPALAADARLCLRRGRHPPRPDHRFRAFTGADAMHEY